MAKQTTSNDANLGFEAELFRAADKLRGNMEPSDYKHVALGLIFLKHISDSFEAKHTELLAEYPEGAEDPDEYAAENVFWVAEQRAIAHILGTLDDKIALNRRMNETLEAMARALFKDWFVDFGPTRAKAESRDPYLAPEIWDMFPDKLDEDGKPEGWEDGKVEDYLELAYGKSLPARSRRPGGVAVYGSGGITGFHDEAFIKGPAIIVGRKGTVGSLYWEDRPIFPIDTVFYVVPKRAALSFCYQLLLSQPLAHMNTDAAVPGLNRNNVYRLEFPWSGSRLTNTFESFASPLWKKRTANLREIDTLSHSRDLLLPKLMSGEIRVGDADKFVQEST